MEITKTEYQPISLKNKVEVFFTQSIQNRKAQGFCITKDMMAVVMDKWSLFVIYNLAYYDMLRFGELKSNIRGVSARMLSVTLKKLEHHQIVERKAFAEIPPRVEYKLTDFGKDLAGKTVELNQWLLDKRLENI